MEGSIVFLAPGVVKGVPGEILFNLIDGFTDNFNKMFMFFLVLSQPSYPFHQLLNHFLHFKLHNLEKLFKSHFVELVEIFTLFSLVVVDIFEKNRFLAVDAVAEGGEIFLDGSRTSLLGIVGLRIRNL